MPKGLQKESNDILIKYWEEGMTSTSSRQTKTIEKAARETSLGVILYQNINKLLKLEV